MKKCTVKSLPSPESSHPFQPVLSVVPVTPFQCVRVGCFGIRDSAMVPIGSEEIQSQAVTGPGSNSWPVVFPADEARSEAAQDPTG